MTGFKTKNSVYTVDTKRSLITGGVFGTRMIEYATLSVIENCRATVKLKNGQVVTTSRVEKIL